MSFKMDMASGTILDSTSPQHQGEDRPQQPLLGQEPQLAEHTGEQESQRHPAAVPQWLIGTDLAAFLARMRG